MRAFFFDLMPTAISSPFAFGFSSLARISPARFSNALIYSASGSISFPNRSSSCGIGTYSRSWWRPAGLDSWHWAVDARQTNTATSTPNRRTISSFSCSPNEIAQRPGRSGTPTMKSPPAAGPAAAPGSARVCLRDPQGDQHEHQPPAALHQVEARLQVAPRAIQRQRPVQPAAAPRIPLAGLPVEGQEPPRDLPGRGPGRGHPARRLPGDGNVGPAVDDPRPQLGRGANPRLARVRRGVVEHAERPGIVLFRQPVGPPPGEGQDVLVRAVQRQPHLPRLRHPSPPGAEHPAQRPGRSGTIYPGTDRKST